MAHVRTIDADTYTRQTRHGYAGTVDTLQPETVAIFSEHAPDWEGIHWVMWCGPNGTTLSPANLAT